MSVQMMELFENKMLVIFSFVNVEIIIHYIKYFYSHSAKALIGTIRKFSVLQIWGSFLYLLISAHTHTPDFFFFLSLLFIYLFIYFKICILSF